MIWIKLQYLFRRDGHGRSVFHGFEHFFHLQGNLAVGRKAYRIILHTRRKPYFLDRSVQRVADKTEHFLVFLGFILYILLFGFALQSQILGSGRTEFLILIRRQSFNDKLIDVVRHIKNFVPLFLQQFGLRQSGDFFYAVAACVIDIFLVGLHAAHVLLKGNLLILGRGMEQQQILKLLFFKPEVIVNAELKA